MRGRFPRGRWCTPREGFRRESDFRPNPRIRDGLDSWCHECHVLAKKAWRAGSPEYVVACHERRRSEYREARFAGSCVREP